MNPGEIQDELADLARQAGLDIRVSSGNLPGDGDLSMQSGICRVRGKVWVVLSAKDPLSQRIEVLVKALQEHALEFLESRYLPPAIREQLDAYPGPG